MKMSNADICNILMQNDHLTDEDKQVLLKILGYENKNEKLSLSNRVSDMFTNFIGSWTFIFISISFIISWMLLNSFILPTNMVFDEFPYVLLNLVLGSIAAIQSPIIMMSQNRQDKRESLKTQSDYEIDLKSIIIIQDLYNKVTEVYNKILVLEQKLDDHTK